MVRLAEIKISGGCELLGIMFVKYHNDLPNEGNMRF